MSERTVLVRLMANITDLKSKLSEAERSVDRYGQKYDDAGKKIDGVSKRADTSLGRMVQSADQNREAWDRAGGSLTVFGAVTVGALAATAKAAIDWESQFAGVEKTVDGTAGQMSVLRGELRGMARELPASHKEIAAVAEAAGQLGISRGGLVDFTRTMVNLGETTNLTADDAATAIAQMANVMGTAEEDIDNVGAALVALGNNGASTERDIVQMAQRISGAGAQIGLTEGEVLGFANALASVGIEAEAGGSAISRVMIETRTAVEDGGEALETFAEVSGMSAAEFRRAFEEDAGGAIISFIQGLGDMEARGESTTGVLDDLGFADLRVADALRRAAADSDGFTASLELGNQAFEDNTALVREAATRYETTAAKIQVAKNNAYDAAIGFGEVLLPAIEGAAEGAKGLAGWLAELDEGQKQAVVSMAGVTGGTALLAGGFLLAFPRVVDTYQAFRDLRDVSPRAADGIGKVGKAAGVTAAALTALSIADDLFSETGSVQSTSEATEALTTYGYTIEDVDKQVRGLTENTRNMSNFFSDARGFETLEQGLRSLADPGLSNRLADINREITSLGGSEGRAERDVLVKQLDAQGEALATLAQSGNAELAAEQFTMFEDAAKAAGLPLEDLLDLMPAYRDALADLKVQENLAGVVQMSDEARAAVFGMRTEVDAVGVLAPQAAAAMDGFESSMRLVGDTTGWTEDQLAEAEDRVKEWQDTVTASFSSFSEPLGVYQGILQAKTEAEQASAQATADATEDATDSWEDHVGTVEVTLEEYAEGLAESNRKQEEWRADLVRIAGRGREGVVEQLIAMGVDGAEITAQLADATDEDFDRIADQMIRDAEFANDGSVAAFVDGAAVMEAVARDGGKSTVEALAKELGLGVGELESIAAQYSSALAGGINPLLDSLGRPRVSLGNRAPMSGPGGVPSREFAQGGFHEDHRAHIAPAGTWRVFAEDETGGEAYIPLSPAKRTRSLDIWRETGRRLGVPTQAGADYADGGFFSTSDIPRPPSTAPYGVPLSTAGDATMSKAYDEARDWVEANTMFGVAMPPGAGATIAGLVAFGRALRAQGISVSENAALGDNPRPGSHSPTGYHYRYGNSGAIDINAGAGESEAEKRRLSPIVAQALRLGFGVQWLAPGHYNHAHVDVGPYRRVGNMSRYLPGGGGAAGGRGVPQAMAKGGIFNPHVRDHGGPLLPGYSLNATGGPEETVIGPAQRVWDATSPNGPGPIPTPAVPVQFPDRLTILLEDGTELSGYVRREAAAGAHHDNRMYQGS